MKKKNKISLLTCASLLILFLIWTALVRFIDVKAIGPQASSVGFATLNKHFHELIGVNMSLYTVTDLLSIIPILFVIGFAALGLIQWIKRKSILKVDLSILSLGVFYVLTAAFFVLFEIFPINYRPVLIDGILEASYPSSTTLLVTCIMPTAIMQLNARIKSPIIKRLTAFILSFFTAFMVIGRLISGVHWLTDIIGGILLSAGLVFAYHLANKFKQD